MQSTKAFERAAIGVIVLSVAWAAGCILPTGHVDLNAPLWCASAGPGAVVGDCDGGGGGSFEVGSQPAPGTMNAVMTVIAYRRDGSVSATWEGPTRWVGRIPPSGMMFTGAVNRGRVTWDRMSAEDVRVGTTRDGSGGLPLRRWLMDRAPDAAEVSVVVTQNGGGARGAVADSTHASGTNAGAGSGAGSRRGARAARRGGYTARGGAFRAGERGVGAGERGVGATSPRGGADGGRGDAVGDGRGRLQRGPRDGGDGSHTTGTRGGSPLGSGRRSSWVDEPTAALSSRGGRVPGPHGAEGGSPAGTGKPGDRGLSMGMPVFGGVISVPSSIAPALDVAAILWETGVSPEALTRKWLGRALRRGERQLQSEITKEAAEHAARAVARTRDKLTRSMDFRLLSAAEQRQILDAMDDAVRREYLASVEKGIAREIVETEQTLVRSRGLPRNEARRYNEKLLRENLEAARRVQDATGQARAELRSAVAPSRASASTARGGTYKLRDPKTGRVRRTGRTNDLNRRQLEHARGKDTKDLRFEVDRRSDNAAARRGREQRIYDQHPDADLNKRRPISPRNRRRDEYLREGDKLE